MAKKNTTKYLSDKQEKKVAKEIGGKQVIASGALWGSKGDTRNDSFLVECKTTQKYYYTLTLKTWEKIFTEATKDGLRTPVMCIDLESGKNRMAVFDSKMMGQYVKFFTPLYESCKATEGKSIHVTSTPTGVTFLRISSKTLITTLHLSIIPWEDFLVMIQES